MSNNTLFKLALSCPDTSDGILSLCKGGVHGSQAPPLVMKEVDKLLELLTQPLASQHSEGLTLSTNASTKVSGKQATTSTSYTFTPKANKAVFGDPLGQSEPDHSKAGVGAAVGEAAFTMSASEVYRAAGWINPFGSTSNSRTEDQAANMAEKIRRELAQRPFLPLVTKDFEEREDHAAATTKIEFEEISQDHPRSQDALSERGNVVAQVVTVSSEKPEATTEPDTQLNGIPRSMAEIYKISNRNRHRNKEKKKLRESVPDTATPTLSEQPFDYFSPKDSPSKKLKGSDGMEDDDTAQVLAQVGWKKGQGNDLTQLGERALSGHR
mmetsp:Transcript_44327/g.56751  ORF Transcript_44327/g.56751 Transcript_44327/m.56751 type:complete len:325 (-) Transcript_44327:115-1089(-)